MNALVLGATGHLGSAFTRELLAQGWCVTVVSRRSEVARNLSGLPVNYCVGDAEQIPQLDEWVRGQDLVVDAAAPYHLRLPDSPSIGEIVRAAEHRMQALLDCVASHHARLAYVSSFTTLTEPTAMLDVVRSSALRLLHPYFEIKRVMETRVRMSVRAGMKAVIVNPTVCLGPWDLKPPHLCLIPLILRRQLPATTDHAINVIDVRDVASATLAALQQERFGQPIALSGHNTTVDGLIAAVCRLGGAVPPRWRVPAHLSALAAYGNEVLSNVGLGLNYPSLGMLALLEQQWQAPGQTQRELRTHLRPLSRTLADAIAWYREIGYLDDVPEERHAEPAHHHPR